MAISRVTTWSSGQVLTAAALNGEFNNILNNPIALWSPAASAINFNGQVLTMDAAAVTTVSSSSSQAWQFTPGAKTGTPSATGAIQNWVASTYTDNNTAASGTAALFAAHALQRPTLAATNTSVTTTDAATLYIANAPLAGTNETLTNAWALLVAAGNVKLPGTANNLGTITTGTWNGSVIGATYGGTGLNSSASTGVPSISSGTWSVASTLATTLGGTGVNTSASTGVPSISSGTWSVAATLATTLGGTGVNTSQRFKLLIGNTRDLSLASSTQSIAHGVTGTPKAVLLFVSVEGGSMLSVGFSDGTTNFCNRWVNNSTNMAQNVFTSQSAHISTTSAGADTDNQAATITFDATNVNLVWTKTGAPAGTAQVNMLVFF